MGVSKERWEYLRALQFDDDDRQSNYVKELNEYKDYLKEEYPIGTDEVSIYIDIETLPSGSRPTLEEVPVPKTHKKPETIQKYREANLEKFYRKQAVNPYMARILNIGLAINDEPAIALRGTQREQLDQLEEITKGRRVVWKGHNVRQFDMFIIYLRAMKFSFNKLKGLIKPDKHRGNVQDSMELLGDNFIYKSHPSLDKLLKFFDIPTSKDGIDGSMVYDFWLAGEHQKIARYACKDVEQTREIFKKIFE